MHCGTPSMGASGELGLPASEDQARIAPAGTAELAAATEKLAIEERRRASVAQFDEYFGEMPWLAIPFELKDARKKMKELTEGCAAKDKELQDLKQTLKFTKIKEYEAELALNVQESQRLRILLEREMRKPKVDPRLFQALKQQNS